ncbi:hypothetical protein D3C81_1319280 [compost metagenome]
MGDDIAQVLLKHHAFAELLFNVRPGKNFVEGVEVFDHFLPPTGAGVNRLQTNRAVVQQMLGSGPRILQREHAEPVEHHIARSLGK